MTSVGLFMAGAALGGLLLQFGTVWPLVLTSVVFSLAMIPLMFGEKPQSVHLDVLIEIQCAVPVAASSCDPYLGTSARARP